MKDQRYVPSQKSTPHLYHQAFLPRLQPKHRNGNWRVVIDAHLLCWEKCREMSGISDHSHEPHHFRRASPVSSFSSLVLMKLASHPVNYQISTKGVIEYSAHPSLVTDSCSFSQIV
ncbi:hypothetical protein I7I53_04838 [Histoplasma capsulatum var. duboisii H88]|uniref:Uncharacterized protein n=1 Tax=Ajellomyces capsulatus (strain H88) TaxID=544711 RepID=A0A8A1LWQ1_AJEC8|nr:hypothetical protein I7I53_04838 [Histoplasma capsulatum var. duboisii H88]